MSKDQDQVVITHLRFRQFLGIADLDLQIPRAGVVFTGSNAVGKSSALFGINALFEGVGVGPDAIRFDAEKAELLVDFTAAMGALSAKREIKREDGTSLRLARADGTAVPRAKEQLKAMFGDRPLDPSKLYAADAKTRRQMILAACQARITDDQLNTWCETQQAWNTDGSGFEVLARVRQMYFDRRTEANRQESAAGARLTLAEEAAARARPEVVEAMTPEAARTQVTAAERELAVLNERRRAAAEREQQGESTRQKVATLRERAEVLLAKPEAIGPTDKEVNSLADSISMLDTQISSLESQLDESRRQRAQHAARKDEVDRARARAAAILAEATAAMAQADELEAAVAHTLDGDGDRIAMQAVGAEEALREARELVARAEYSARYRAQLEQVAEAKKDRDAAAALTVTLDRIVTRLTKEAPAELAKEVGIPGLEVTPADIRLDGKNIDRLSGAEKLRLCVALAKKVVNGAKILTVDEMEKIAPSLLPGFVRECIADGWQLFGTRVEDGDLDVVDCYQLAEGK